MKKTIIVIAVLCLSALLLAGCGSGADNTNTGSTTVGSVTTGSTVQSITGTTAPDTQMPAQSAMSTYAAHTVKIAKLAEIAGVKIDGRTVTYGDGIVFEWPASGFVIEGELEGDVSVTINYGTSESGCRLRIWIDGEDCGMQTIKGGKHVYVLAEGLKKGKHTIRIAKASEAYTYITVTDVSFTGKLSAPKASGRKIEFFGDSITAGVDLYRKGLSVLNNDGTKTYAALTAEALGADYHVIALGGWGCMAGSTSVGQRIPTLIERASYVFDGAKWDTAQWQPDVVVINLGTNDWSFMQNSPMHDLTLFENSVKNYLKLIRSKYPNAHVVWAYGMMGNPLENSLQKVVNELRNGDAKMHYVALPLTVRGNGGYHPSYEDSEICSEVLVEYIKGITDWT